MDYILNELKTKAGTQFDPKVAAAMVSLIESHELEGIEEFETTKKLDDMLDDKDSVFSGSGVYLLDEITTKNANKKNSLGQISTEDWAKTFQKHIEEQLFREDGRLFVIDVDNMNQINSEFGYAKGDQVLQAIHHVLMQKENILASMRSGGDEFICWVETPLSNQEYEERLKGLLGDIKDAIQQETTVRMSVFPSVQLPLWSAAATMLRCVKMLINHCTMSRRTVRTASMSILTVK